MFFCISTASRVNDTTTKVSQQEIVFPARPESNILPARNGPNSIINEHKPSYIGGSHSFTDMPPNEYGIMSKGMNVRLWTVTVHPDKFSLYLFTANKLNHRHIIYDISATILVFVILYAYH